MTIPENTSEIKEYTLFGTESVMDWVTGTEKYQPDEKPKGFLNRVKNALRI